MKTLVIELLENSSLKKRESQTLGTDTSGEFIEALVLLCHRLDIDVPLWTYREEKILQRKNEVYISDNPDNDIVIKVYTE